MTFPRFVAFDPGLTVGVAYFDAEGNATGHGQISFDQLLDVLAILQNYQLESANLTIIVEDFELLEHKARAVARNRHSRKMEASQSIGALKLFAKLAKAELIMQPPQFGSIAKTWTGLDPDVSHSKSNWKSAFNHGVYYLVRTLELHDYKNPPTPKAR